MRTDLSALNAHCRDVLHRFTANGTRPDYPRQFIVDGRRLLDGLYAGEDAAPALPDFDKTKLGVALHVIWLRDRAWCDLTPGNAASRAVLWVDVAMAVPPVFGAPAMFLSGCASALAGDDDTARRALHIALLCQPRYTAALHLKRLLNLGPSRGYYDLSDSSLPAPPPSAALLRPLVNRILRFMIPAPRKEYQR
ncbi:DUF4192 family protein [Streptosporangium sp. NPDC050280]|uniref:DUF4192 family protein n=1 Tax=unclassified Streptosporangium TaxID=2632669 RepID=UPI003441B920